LASSRKNGRVARAQSRVASQRIVTESVMKKYVKPALTKLGTLKLIKANATGPSSDGKKYAGFFK
jgi:hypothetical protein